MQDAGIPVPDSQERWEQALKALKAWALTCAALLQCQPELDGAARKMAMGRRSCSSSATCVSARRGSSVHRGCGPPSSMSAPCCQCARWAWTSRTCAWLWSSRCGLTASAHVLHVHRFICFVQHLARTWQGQQQYCDAALVEQKFDMGCMHPSASALLRQLPARAPDCAYLQVQHMNLWLTCVPALLQRVVPAAYAFVIHTHNPTNNSAEEVFAEVVLGLGESIVSGLVPGAALSFKCRKSALEKPEVRACAILIFSDAAESSTAGA